MESAAAASLVLTEPAGQREIPLDAGYMWRIGRDAHSDVVVADKRVSRDHAIIQRADSGDYYLIDMGSLNGSYVNSSRVSTPALLKDGDSLSFGSSVFMFRGPASLPGAHPGDLSVTEATQAWFVRRSITVLVVDVRDFTGLTQRIDQALLCQTIGTFFRRSSEITRRQGVWALKYIGDAVMAVWLHAEEQGAGAARDIVSVLRTVLELASIADGLQAKFRLPSPVRIGAGINTGFASVGNSGSRSVADYTALGDAVNAAFRMESATKETGSDVVLGAGTVEALQRTGAPESRFHPRTVSLKGYENPVDVWCASLRDIQEFLTEAAPAGAAR